MKSLIPCLLMVVVLLFAASARSAEQEKTPPEIENLAKEFVRKLGNPKFQEREAAYRELANLGLDARQAIEEGLKNPDLEIRIRCEALYPLIRVLDLKRRVEVFASDQEGRGENTLPLGATYEKICGKDENARKFFIELCLNNLQLFDDAAADPQKMGEAYFDLSNEIQYRDDTSPAPPDAPVDVGDDTLYVTKIAAMLLIGADETIGPIIAEANRTQPNRDNGQPLARLIWQTPFRSALIDVNKGRDFRKLLFAWAKRCNDGGTAIYVVLDTLQQLIKTEGANLQDDPDTLEFVVDVAGSAADNSGVNSGVAMMVMADLVKKDQIPFIEKKFFKDERKLSDVDFQFNDQTKAKVEIRVCDYALWICLKLSGQSFQDYGFDILDPRRELNAYSFAGFTKDETRKTAFQKYAEWRNANPIDKD
jgi:hypothetical protein